MKYKEQWTPVKKRRRKKRCDQEAVSDSVAGATMMNDVESLVFTLDIAAPWAVFPGLQ